MTNDEAEQFAGILAEINDYYGGRMGGADMWWRGLEQFPMEQVRRALDAHVKDPATGKFPPTIADVVGRIERADGQMGAEEAWARCKFALGDEGATLCVTDAMRAAFLAADALADDKIAARMAFKEVYDRELAAGRRLGRLVNWTFILGHDAASRDECIRAAVRDGKVLPAYAAKLLGGVANPIRLEELTALAPEGVQRRLRDLKGLVRHE